MKTSQAGPARVSRYIAGFPREVRPVLERVRATIRNALPGSDEAIAYNIPAFKVGGRVVIYLAGWKAHYSLYPSTNTLLEAFKDELAPYASGRGTIRFPLAEPVPARLIARVVKFRAREVAAKARASRRASR